MAFSLMHDVHNSKNTLLFLDDTTKPQNLISNQLLNSKKNQTLKKIKLWRQTNRKKYIQFSIYLILPSGKTILLSIK